MNILQMINQRKIKNKSNINDYKDYFFSGTTSFSPGGNV